MNVVYRYISCHVWTGFVATAIVLVPLFTIFDFITELEDVSSVGYQWVQALEVVTLRIPRVIVNLSPFIALLGGIIGLGQLSKTFELTAIRSAGYSIFRISIMVLLTGLVFTVALSAIDEWIASPLQQQAQELKNTALASVQSPDDMQAALWAKSDDEYVRVQRLDKNGQPHGIEIFKYNPDLSLQAYQYADSATVKDAQSWILHNVSQKEWNGANESFNVEINMLWHSAFPNKDLHELLLPIDSYSISQLRRYIEYLSATSQPSQQYQLSLWQKIGRPILVLAMVLLSIPFTFSNPREPGLGRRLALGVTVGLLTYISVQITIDLGLLFTLNPPLTALTPPLMIFIFSFWSVYRFDKSH